MKAYIIMKCDNTLIDEPIGICFDKDKCMDKVHCLNNHYLDWEKDRITNRNEWIKNKPDWYYLKDVDVLE